LPETKRVKTIKILAKHPADEMELKKQLTAILDLRVSQRRIWRTLSSDL
jgi:hypothetical protein